MVLDYSANQRLISRNGNQVSYAAPHGVYRCKGEDRWVAIAVFTDEEWNSFCQTIGNPDWVKDAKFATLSSRVKYNEELNTRISEWTVNFTAEEVMEKLQAANVAAGKVSDGRDLFEDPQLNALEQFQEADHPYIGKRKIYHPCSFTLSEARADVTAPVILGAHTEYVATKIIGLSDTEFVQLMEEGVFE